MNALGKSDYISVLSQVTEIITNLIGEDVVAVVGISPNSAFIADLGMDSIQIAVVADKINVLYGEQVDFVRWLSKRPLPALLRLTVGDVVDFIVKGR